MTDDIDIIPLPMTGGVTTHDLFETDLPVAGLYLGADPDERCDDCLIRPDDYLFDCPMPGNDEGLTLCRSCAERHYPLQMHDVISKLNGETND